MEHTAANSEREWILIGMAESCATLGYEATAIKDVCVAAGVSRPAFDDLFAGKEDCLAAAMDALLDEARARIEAAASPDKPWASILRDSVAATLELLAERPAFARTALIEAPTAGGRAGQLYDHARAFVLSYVEQGKDQATEEPETPATASRAAVAGAEGLIAGRILNGQTEQLRDLTPDVVYVLTVPYLGQPAALRAAQPQGRPRTLRAVA